MSFIHKTPKWRLILLIAVIILLTGCSSQRAADGAVKQNQQKKEEFIVSAAASLKNALTDIQTLYNSQSTYKMMINFASSGTLQHQIEQGAPVDVFISAAKSNMDALSKEARDG